MRKNQFISIKTYQLQRSIYNNPPNKPNYADSRLLLRLITTIQIYNQPHIIIINTIEQVLLVKIIRIQEEILILVINYYQ